MERVDCVVIGAGRRRPRLRPPAGHGRARGDRPRARRCDRHRDQLAQQRGDPCRHLLRRRAASRRGSASRASSSSTATAPSAGVAHVRCGKLIVATDEAQLAHARDHPAPTPPALGHARPRALDGRAGATRWSRHSRCTGALWSPTTGVIDSHGLMLAYLADAERARRHDRVREPAASGPRSRPRASSWRSAARSRCCCWPGRSSTAPACTRLASPGASPAATSRACRRPITARATTTAWPAARRSRG